MKIEAKWRECREKIYGSDFPTSADEGVLFDAEIGSEDEHYELSDDDCTHYVEKEIDFSFDEYISKFSRADVLKW